MINAIRRLFGVSHEPAHVQRMHKRAAKLTLVVAGTVAEYKEYLARNAVDPETAIYVSRPCQIRQLHKPGVTIVLYGHWKLNPCANMIPAKYVYAEQRNRKDV